MTATTAPSQRSVTEVVLPGCVEPDGLRVRTRPAAAVRPGHVLLRMEATGVSFAEQQMRRGSYYDQPPFPFVPGYDLVGTAVAVGPGVDGALVGQRFAAVTKTGAWASLVEVDATDLLPVPDDVDPVTAEALAVNGITAWQMLHDIGRVRRDAVVVVLGANGGVGSTLVQLAVHAGARVVGTSSARHHDLLRSLGAEPVDSRDPDLDDRIRELAPDGADLVLDHVGGPGLLRSWRLLRRGGTLVSYGSASTMDLPGGGRIPVLRAFARVVAWDVLPNGRRARFYNFWAGSRRRQAFALRQRDALSHVLALTRSGAVRPLIAGQLPLSQIARAVELAESRTVAGKVVVTPDA